jgi:hypothetical protein
LPQIVAKEIALKKRNRLKENGSIISNGDKGGDTDPSNPPFGGFAGNDAAG